MAGLCGIGGHVVRVVQGRDGLAWSVPAAHRVNPTRKVIRRTLALLPPEPVR